MVRKIRALFVLFFVVLLSFIACHRAKDQPAISFYYWRTHFALKANEAGALHDNHVAQLYLHYFDINYEPALTRSIPVAPITFSQKVPDSIAIVPVVYIKNNVLENSKPEQIGALAANTWRLISQINNAAGIAIKELQLDCDWTATTAPLYFAFIDSLRKYAVQNKRPVLLSATIRLHQVKYPDKTGVPPVDKGVLMYYNMGKINTSEQLSIYDRPTALKYISACKKYPLRLDVALPVFAWCIHLREGKVVELLGKMDERDLLQDSLFTKTGNYRYRANTDLFKNGFYFKANDEVKVEQLGKDQILQMAQDLNSNCSKSLHQVLFYDLDSLNISRYDAQIFKQVGNYFY